MDNQYDSSNTLEPGDVAEDDPSKEKRYCPDCKRVMGTMANTDTCINCFLMKQYEIDE